MRRLLVVIFAVFLAVSFCSVFAQTEDLELSMYDSDVLELVGLTPEQEREMYEIMSRGDDGYWCGPSSGTYGKGELCWYRSNHYFYATFSPKAFYNGARRARACALNIQTDQRICGGYVGVGQTSSTQNLFEGSGILYSPKWEAY